MTGKMTKEQCATVKMVSACSLFAAYSNNCNKAATQGFSMVCHISMLLTTAASSSPFLGFCDFVFQILANSNNTSPISDPDLSIKIGQRVPFTVN